MTLYDIAEVFFWKDDFGQTRQTVAVEPARFVVEFFELPGLCEPVMVHVAGNESPALLARQLAPVTGVVRHQQDEMSKYCPVFFVMRKHHRGMFVMKWAGRNGVKHASLPRWLGVGVLGQLVIGVGKPVMVAAVGFKMVAVASWFVALIAFARRHQHDPVGWAHAVVRVHHPCATLLNRTVASHTGVLGCWTVGNDEPGFIVHGR